MSGRKAVTYDEAVLPMLSNEDLRSLVEGGMPPHLEVSAKFRRAAGSTLGDPTTKRYLEFKRQHDKERGV